MLQFIPKNININRSKNIIFKTIFCGGFPHLLKLAFKWLFKIWENRKYPFNLDTFFSTMKIVNASFENKNININPYFLDGRFSDIAAIFTSLHPFCLSKYNIYIYISICIYVSINQISWCTFIFKTKSFIFKNIDINSFKKNFWNTLSLSVRIFPATKLLNILIFRNI